MNEDRVYTDDELYGLSESELEQEIEREKDRIDQLIIAGNRAPSIYNRYLLLRRIRNNAVAENDLSRLSDEELNNRFEAARARLTETAQTTELSPQEYEEFNRLDQERRARGLINPTPSHTPENDNNQAPENNNPADDENPTGDTPSAPEDENNIPENTGDNPGSLFDDPEPDENTEDTLLSRLADQDFDTITVANDYNHSVEELDQMIAEIEEEQKRRRNPYANLSNDELLAQLQAIEEEMQFRTHQQNGMEYNEDDDLLERYRAVRGELDRRLTSVYVNISDEELDRQIAILTAELGRTTEPVDNREIDERIRRLEQALENRRRREMTLYSNVSDEELDELLNRAYQNRDRFRRLEEEYARRSGTTRTGYEHLSEEELNRLIEESDRSNETLRRLEEERIRRTVITRTGYEHLSEEELNRLIEESDRSNETLRRLEEERIRRSNRTSTEFAEMTEEEIERTISEIEELRQRKTVLETVKERRKRRIRSEYEYTRDEEIDRLIIEKEEAVKELKKYKKEKTRREIQTNSEYESITDTELTRSIREAKKDQKELEALQAEKERRNSEVSHISIDRTGDVGTTPLFDDYVPESIMFTSRGMTQEEYIIQNFEQQTGLTFDPDVHEIRYNNDATDDGYDNPISTYSIIEKQNDIGTEDNNDQVEGQYGDLTDDDIDRRIRELGDPEKRLSELQAEQRRRKTTQYSAISEEELEQHLSELSVTERELQELRKEKKRRKTRIRTEYDYTSDEEIDRLIEEIDTAERRLVRLEEERTRRSTQTTGYESMTDTELDRRISEIRNTQERGMTLRLERERRRTQIRTEFDRLTDTEIEERISEIRNTQERGTALRLERERRRTYTRTGFEGISDEELDRRIREAGEINFTIAELEREKEIRNSRATAEFSELTDDEISQQIEDLRRQRGTGNGNTDREAVQKRLKLLTDVRDARRRLALTTVPDNRYSRYSDEDLERRLEELQSERTKARGDQRKVYINDTRTSNVIPGKGFNLSNGEYVSQQEIMEAVRTEMDNLGPNQVVVCKKTGRVVSADEIEAALTEAAMEDSILRLTPGNPKIKARNYGLDIKDAENPREEYEHKGNLIVGNKEDVPEDRYIRGQIVKEVLDDYKIKSVITHGEDIEVDKDAIKERVTDMLDKYYGHSKKEKAYRKALAEYKKHIITGPDGIRRVEDFEGRKQLEHFLQLEDFGYKLESLSMLEKGDKTRYFAMVQAYDEIGYAWPKNDDGSDLTTDQKFNLLVSMDRNYVETYNNAYNQHASTYRHLKTLGKHGEKAPYAKILPIRDKDGKVQPKVVFTNVAKALMNVGIFGRNHIKAPLNRAVGTLIVAPVQKLLFNADKHTAGLYKNQATHRYAARRDYFEQEYLQKFAEENERRVKAGKKPKPMGLSFMIKMTNYARFHATVDYKKGNAMVLAAGACDIENSEREKAELRQKEAAYRRQQDQAIADSQSKIAGIQRQIAGCTDPTQKQQLEAQLTIAQAELRVAQEKRAMPLTGLLKTQNDAVSMATHEKANKDNVTHTVTGIKTAAKIAAAKFIGPSIRKKITETTQQWIPSRQVVTSQEEITPEGIKDITFEDLMKTSKEGQVDYYAGGGRTVSRSDDFIRGIEWKGTSGTDGVGYNIAEGGIRISTTQVSPISKSDSVVEKIAEMMTNATGQTVTPDDIVAQIYNSDNPAQALTELTSNLNVWTSTSPTGIARGWLNGFSNTAELIEAATRTVETVTTIPGHMEVIETTREVLNPAVASAIVAMGASTVGDMYDEARRTNSAEDMVAMGIRKKPPEEREKESKAPYRERNPEKKNPYGFTGTRKGDYATNYDERQIADSASQMFEGGSEHQNSSENSNGRGR